MKTGTEQGRGTVSCDGLQAVTRQLRSLQGTVQGTGWDRRAREAGPQRLAEQRAPDGAQVFRPTIFLFSRAFTSTPFLPQSRDSRPLPPHPQREPARSAVILSSPQ